MYHKKKNGQQKVLQARSLKRWDEDGTLEKLKGRSLALGEEKGMSDWKDGAVDGYFTPWALVAGKV